MKISNSLSNPINDANKRGTAIANKVFGGRRSSWVHYIHTRAGVGLWDLVCQFILPNEGKDSVTKLTDQQWRALFTTYKAWKENSDGKEQL